MMHLWSGISNDIRFAVRQARKRALFSAACVGVLGLGLGANTAIFSVLYSAVLQPLPFRAPAQLLAIHNRFPLLSLPRLNASSLDYLDLRQQFFTLFAAVTCLLLIVGTNIAGLLSVRSTERHVDVSVRMALGASRFRIARQVITEVLLLAFLGGLAAILVAGIALRLLQEYSPLPDPNVSAGAPVWLFGSLLCLLTGLACSLLPAWVSGLTASHAEQRQTASIRKTRLRHGFIVAQVGLATALLLCGGLLIRSMLRLIETPLGFNAHNVLTMEITLPHLRYLDHGKRRQFFQTATIHERYVNTSVR